ncbi:hypothetical protein PF007_g8620 [Phytophthora fragariae]|uniref:Uncharacterized protein n=1 Tax=Phytophthora fragariae TaxID=53985 RepID=A0A6A3U9G6_9STRA|nr:hypothetical protein PF009_g8906 [Phytophthora fragariae]KAE9119245.1 hypothetical protein PF007_g8620 [Phytophthora fragariae]KAE9148012.1 hypothetical protein PF006_g7365 [Phytophthora fragariae]
MDLPPKSRRYCAAVAAAKFADLRLEFWTRKDYNGSRKRFAVFCMKEWYPDPLNNRFVGVSRTRLGVVFYPFCWFPFPVDFSISDDGVGDRHGDATDLPDNDTFEYDGSERSDDSSVDEYHPSDFDSESDGSDEDYNDNDEQRLLVQMMLLAIYECIVNT